MSTLLEVAIGEDRYPVRSKADLVEALGKRWKCHEVRSVHYAEDTNDTPEQDVLQRGQPEPIGCTRERIIFRLPPALERDDHIQRIFSPRIQHFFFLSNHSKGRRMILTNSPLTTIECSGEAPTPVYSLARLMAMEQICKEWDKLLDCCTQQLNSTRAVIMRRNRPEPQNLLINIAEIAEIVSGLENTHHEQLEFQKSLNTSAISWYKGFNTSFSDCTESIKRMEAVGNHIQSNISSKIDVLFQRTSNIMSIDEALKSRAQGASIKRLSWITFIFLPLLFVSSLYGMNVDILKSSPSWTTYFYISVPVFSVVMVSVFLIKHRKQIYNRIRSSCSNTKLVTMTNQRLARLRMRLQFYLSDLILGCQKTFFGHLAKVLNRDKKSDEENQCTYELREVRDYSQLCLYEAAKDGDSERIGWLISLGVLLGYRNKDGWIATQLAALHGHSDIVNQLLEAGANVNTDPAEQGGRTALQAAAEGGDLAIINRLLKVGVDVNHDPSARNGRTALQAAAGSGHLDIVNRLLRTNADINARPAKCYGRTALQAAAECGHSDIVTRLLKAGADFKFDTPSLHGGRTALQAAAGSGNLDILNLLLEAGADLHAQPSEYEGRTALQAAADGGYLDVVIRLLELGSDVNSKPSNYHGRTPLQAASEGGYLEIVCKLLHAGAEVNAEPATENGRTALQAAAEGGHLQILDRLLQVGSDAKAKPSQGFNGRTALQAAAGRGYLHIVNRLMDHGADVNTGPSPHSGKTALQAAAGGGHIHVLQRLLNLGADIRAEPSPHSGRTALQAAAENGHLEVVNLLLSLAPDHINAEPARNNGLTAIQAAVNGRHLDVVSLLLDAGADVNAKPAPISGRTALQAAAENGYLEAVDPLLESEADVNAEPAYDNGRTALQAAAEVGHLNVVRRLLERGADVNSKDRHGITALRYAIVRNYPDVEVVLRGSGAKEFIE
ncbi:Similar to Putative ankyrin repeat protein RF_0381; acc. no. Q4UMH6 [Pyronema omphalodes CBS 100304]|uniref:Similar to Putative ankyrin repeat protein RF_0381 acc. no. Q4UMH6 n=1 Tax=Pyronema omphalodes (strain CBS 100304) TaxID=1076935 RepID=U4LTT3_PYROM|nr:Similar to Putative ankyrin repeat protein RF_0381; acc. no. Q4UMH6 [Pyronema omphalodes CBS 100304]